MKMLWQCFMSLSILILCNASNITNNDIEIEKILRRLNKTPVKSIQSPDGDIIDCIDIYKQPAFDNPLLQNHTIVKVPSYHPLKNLSAHSKLLNFTPNNTEQIPQLWHVNGSCPEGTIPVRRTTKEDLLRAGDISRYGMKDPNSIPGIPGNHNPSEHEYAVAYARRTKYYGAWATLNVWRPQVNRNDEISLSQVWLVRGSGRNLNTVEAGWIVHPVLYGDRKTRLFTYWTSDGYRSTGCYNLLCQGFVQTNQNVALNAVIDPVSVYGSLDSQIELTVLIWQEAQTGNWHLEFNNAVYGYWPGSIFNQLHASAEMVEWGGEITNKKAQGRHTTTQMGSGHFSNEMLGGASYVKNMLAIDETRLLKKVPQGHLETHNSRPTCYDVRLMSSNYDWGDYIFFGGPGYNPQCP